MNIFNITSGITIGALAPDVEDSYGLFKNGIFKRTKNQVGTFVHKVAETPDNMGVDQTCEISFVRDDSIPKIPYQIFQSILKFYKDVYKDIKSEVYTLVVWDKVNKDFFIHVPEQEVSGATVRYTNNSEIYNNPNYLVYCDFHSHNTMNAFFSSTDTKDEVAGRYFGVIGKIFDELPALALKASFNRQAVLLGYHDLFDIETEKLHEHSNYYLDYEAMKGLIKERTYTYPKYPVYKGKGSYKPPVNNYNSKPKNIVVKNKTHPSLYNFDDYIDDGDWDDIHADFSEDLGLQVDSYINENFNLSKKTIFEKDPEDLTAFMYDFRKIFKSDKNDCSEKDLVNIFQSLFDLILDFNDVEESSFESVIQEIKTVYSKAFESDPKTPETEEVKTLTVLTNSTQ